MPELAVPDPGYDERLGVPLRWWVQGVMLLATFWLAFVVAIPGAVPWLITGVLGLVLVVALASIGSARVGVAGGSLHAGRAQIGLEHLGTAEALDAEATRLAMGAGRRRPRLPRDASLPEARGAGADHRSGRPDAVLAGRLPAPGSAGRRHQRALRHPTVGVRSGHPRRH